MIAKITWENEYPFNTFQGETKRELIEYVKSIEKNAVEDGMRLAFRAVKKAQVGSHGTIGVNLPAIIGVVVDTVARAYKVNIK